MCGIVGLISLNGGPPIDASVVNRMNDLQAHRGPDGEGFLLSSLTPHGFRDQFLPRLEGNHMSPNVRVALGHRRLAIIDLSDRGLQPMTAAGSDTWIVFNGEIYNHTELRSELQTYGYTFKTRTDTEVLLNAYLKWGESCLERLDGMFGFAIWDSRLGRLFCARDRFGIKPFYYATPRGYFVFASEMKSLLAFPGVDKSADDEAVLGFLAHGNCDYGETTIIGGIKALTPGHSLTLDLATDQYSQRRYWHLRSRPDDRQSDNQRVDHLRELLVKTTRKHLLADVPVGSCLSGGLDSSTVVSLIGKIRREQPGTRAGSSENFDTFTSCYEYRELDERGYALAVAGSLKAKSHLVFPSANDFWSDFERMAWHQDMPFSALSYYAQWRVMRAARDAGIKVLLDGQGGDEVFGGYAKFRYAYLATLLRSGRASSFAREVWAMLKQRDLYVLDLRKGYRYLPSRLRRLLQVDSLLKKTIKADWSAAVSTDRTPATRWWRNALDARAGADSLTTMQSVQIDDIELDTLPHLLRMEDRSSMAFSLEARVPLLDHEVVEYGLSLPDHLKVHDGWSKFAVREAMRGVMPEAVRWRKSKLGFAAPDRYWLLNDLRGRVNALLADPLRCQKYIDTAAVRRWYNSEESRRANTESFLGLFRILSLEMWMRAFQIS
jgi:asparagine synthase (glutamine-hydrolysing)